MKKTNMSTLIQLKNKPQTLAQGVMPKIVPTFSQLVLCGFLTTSSSSILAQEIPTIVVEATEISDVSTTEIKSADLSDALTKQVSNISLIRRSGIANDIILRGQNKDNINITIDNGKIYGACPNRMDPPTSHILTNNIDNIQIIEGPYDVENFGSLSGSVKVKTKKPAKKLTGEVSVNMGSWNYKKYAMTLSGGNDFIRGLVSVSKENSEQYQDGSGRSLAEQIQNNNLSPMVSYKNQLSDMDAYDKHTFMSKIFIKPTNNQELNLSYTMNRSDDILYASSKMDALYDDSNIFNIDYSILNLSKYSNKLSFEYYHSDVEHPMSTKYRNSSATNAANERVSKLTTDMQGIKIKNHFNLSDDLEANIGLDMNQRKWNGEYLGYGMSSFITGRKSIDQAETVNRAIFTEIKKDMDKLTLKTGLRYDVTDINSQSVVTENNYNSLGGFVHASYQFTETSRFFAGLGQSSRVPDARELYFKSAGMMPTSPVVTTGTSTLDDTKNIEVDWGMEHHFNSLSLKATFFHSWLKDYIYYNSSKTSNNFENIDATTYGLDITGMYAFSDEMYLDFGFSYQRGKKDQALATQTDTDLANITPAKLLLAMNYDYNSRSSAKLEMNHVAKWKHFDADNGEQAIDSFTVFNLKVKHGFNKHIEVTGGIDNLFDKTYAVSNTYKDLTLLTDGTGSVMLLNEPGRYYYLNLAYKL